MGQKINIKTYRSRPIIVLDLLFVEVLKVLEGREARDVIGTTEAFVKGTVNGSEENLGVILMLLGGRNELGLGLFTVSAPFKNSLY